MERLATPNGIRLIVVIGFICMLICIYFIVETTLSIRELTAEIERLKNK